MNSISIALAFPFLGSVSALFRRSSSASPRVTEPIRCAQLAANGHHVVVPVLESVVSMQATELACQVAAERQATIMLACVVQVPDSVGLDERLPGAEERAKRLLRQAESIVLQHGLQAESCVLQQHNAEDAILELARGIGAEAIVVGVADSSRWSSSEIGQTVSGLTQHAPCQVVIAKSPLSK